MRITNLSIVLTLAGFLFLSSLTPTMSAPVATDSPPTEKSFPGLNEVVPQATAVTIRISDTETQIQQAEELDDDSARLDALTESLKKLEELYSDWNEVNNWQLIRLRGAQSSYIDLKDQWAKPLVPISSRLATLEELHSRWEQEKTYWQEWQDSLKKTGVKAPVEVFSATQHAIVNLLNRITKASGVLVKAQQKYSPGQEVLTSRLKQINNTLDSLRKNSFRRDAFSLLEPDYYRQYNGELIAGFMRGLVSSVTLPNTFFKRYSVANTLHLFGIVTILLLLLYRKRQHKTISEEWRFLYLRPLSGAVFITLIIAGLAGDSYPNAPPLWELLLAISLTIAAVRLLSAIYQQSFARNFVRTIATLSIVNVGLQVFGIPAPVMQFVQGLLCAVAAPVCLLQIRKYRQDMLQKHLVALYLICGVALLGFILAVLGYATLTTNLIDATLSTFILIILTQMALRIISGGVLGFMALEWVKNRQFMLKLGVEATTHKLQTLLRIIVLVNVGFHLPVIWNIFDNIQEAHDFLLDFSFTFGEFSFSLKMVLMVVVILYLTSLFSWVVQAFLDTQVMTPNKMDIGVKESLKRLTHYGLFTIGFFVALSTAGFDLQKFTIIAGALGVGIGFGLQNIVSNFVSGLILLFERPVKVGDTVTIGEDWGIITKIGLRATIFETFDRSEVIVPNADLLSNKVTNWTLSSKTVRVQFPIGVAYGSPLEKVMNILERAAQEHEEVLSYPDLSIIFDGFGASSIDFNLRFWVKSIDDRVRIRTDVAIIIDRLFREEGISIPFPQQDLHLRSIEPNLQTLFGKKSIEGEGGDEGKDEGPPV
ncbi:MAG: mechanosensitive ion channel [Desulfuromusa sp.]|nr:mechanosensitive ion channel [Desulfuromusa sp.]